MRFATHVLLLANWVAGAAEVSANKSPVTPTVPASVPSQSFTSSYSPREGKWQIAWPGRLSQHDVVYLSPPEDPSLGLPIGNGDLGALLWTTDSKLVLAINKCDTWDDNKPGHFGNWSREEEEAYTTLRHGGRLVIDFGCPVFDLLYQQDFQARLELASAQASLRAATPFAKVAVSSFVSAADQVLVLRGETSSGEEYTRQIELERWGSRTFGHWYSSVVRDPVRGLDGTETAVEKSRIVIHQKLRTLSFVLAAQVVPDGQPVMPRKLHSRAGVVDLPPSVQAGFTIYVSAVTSENDPDPVSAVHRILDRAVARGEAAIRQKHESDWKEFWSKSMVELPEKYLENSWYLNLYYANSSSRGDSPPLFSNGLWSWNRDFSPWIYYFHWNEQWSVWPLHAANHAELAIPYFRYRRAQLPHAMDFAQKHLKKPGAFYSDVADRRGYNSRGEAHNLTPGAQIALDFWRHYGFTRDDKFLRDSAWPVIREVARFYAASLKVGDDGFYHISGSSAYEGSPLFDDTITDLAMIRALFPVAVRAGKLAGHEQSEISQWQTQVDGLAPFHRLDLETSEFERVGDHLVHRGGLAPGRELASDKVFAVGRNKKGEWVRNRYAGRKLAYYGIPDPEIAPIVPGGVIGLAQRGTELFQTAVTQLRLHPGGLTNPGPTAVASTDFNEVLCTGWCPYAIALARLGLAEEAVSVLTNFVSNFQLYPQGFGHWSHNYQREQDNRWGQNLVADTNDPKRKFPFPTWPFRHFSFEPSGIAASAINEMLLQSHDGSIRVGPAVPPTWNVRFDLVAQGGFRVNAELNQGSVSWASVESQFGGPCQLIHPWPADGRIICLDMITGNEPKRVTLLEESAGPDRVLRWETVAGHRYLLLRDEAMLEHWNVVKDTPRRARSRVVSKGRSLAASGFINPKMWKLVMKKTFKTAPLAVACLICAVHFGPGSVFGAGRESLPAPGDVNLLATERANPHGKAATGAKAARRCSLYHLQPAKEWVDGYPLGNGMQGAMVLGGITNERVALNHGRLWRQSVERHEFQVADKLTEFRRLFLAGQFQEAGRLMEKEVMLSGGKMYPYVNPYQSLGDLLLDFSLPDEVTEYQRRLDMDSGIVEVTYRAGQTRFRREYFMATPTDNVMVVRITAEGPGRISGQIRLNRTERADDYRTHESVRPPDCPVTNKVTGNLLILAASLPEGFPFGAVARVTSKGGTISPQNIGPQNTAGASLTVRDAREVLILVAMATGHESREPVAWCKGRLAALRFPFGTLRQRHLQDHQQLFRRVRFSLDDPQPERPTDQLIEEALRSKQASLALFQRLFDFGRYLLISGSRPGGLPMNLQGIWNDQNRPPWDCDYHMDLNLEFNYWPAEVCNLSELHQPLFDWAEARIPDGRRLARELFGCRGIYFPIVADATGLGNSDNLTYSFPGTAGWIAQHFWRHYEFTGDRDFLARRAYPFLKEVAAFYLDYLMKDSHGNYVILPSGSPENGVKGRAGWMHFTTISSTIDLEIAREVFTHLVCASEILKVDADQATRWREVLEHLPMPAVNKQGRLLEWSEPVEAADPAHRHLSPLYALFPGDRIPISDSPQWMEAARKLLEYRLQFGSGSANGWSYPWRAALFARLGEGDKALGQLDDLARSCVNENLLTLITDWRGQGLTVNWFGGKKVFQIEAGLATPAAMAEMLMQSHGGCIRILPALPARWATGRIDGLVARGGFVIGIDWMRGQADRIRVHSRLGQACRLKVAHPSGTISLSSSGRRVPYRTLRDGVMEFQTRVGKDYELRVSKEDQ